MNRCAFCGRFVASLVCKREETEEKTSMGTRRPYGGWLQRPAHGKGPLGRVGPLHVVALPAAKISGRFPKGGHGAVKDRGHNACAGQQQGLLAGSGKRDVYGTEAVDDHAQLRTHAVVVEGRDKDDQVALVSSGEGCCMSSPRTQGLSPL